MNRKEFIFSSAMSAIALTTFGSVVKSEGARFTGDCETTNDILGPFYRPDAPVRSDLTYPGLEGSLIVIRGIVRENDCVTPVHNAMVEIWHCDTRGEYDNETQEYRHRARWKTNNQGQYEFHTIFPGKYLNGKLYRPSHIHYRITCEGYKEVISQIYFENDPHIITDPWASSKNASSRILKLIPETTDGKLTILFDIYLGRE